MDILIADDFIEFGSSGRIFDKRDVLDILPNSPTEKWTIAEFDVKVLAPVCLF